MNLKFEAKIGPYRTYSFHEIKSTVTETIIISIFIFEMTPHIFMVAGCGHFPFSCFRVFSSHFSNAKSGNREIEKAKIEKLRNREIGKSRNREIEKSKNQEIGKSGNRFSLSCFRVFAFLISRFPNFPFSRFSNFSISRFPVFQFLDFSISRFLNFSISRFPDFPISRLQREGRKHENAKWPQLATIHLTCRSRAQLKV